MNPWEKEHTHTQIKKIESGQIYFFNININQSNQSILNWISAKIPSNGGRPLNYTCINLLSSDGLVIVSSISLNTTEAIHNVHIAQKGSLHLFLGRPLGLLPTPPVNIFYTRLPFLLFTSFQHFLLLSTILNTVPNLKLSLTISFLTWSLLVTPTILLNTLISVACILDVSLF